MTVDGTTGEHPNDEFLVRLRDRDSVAIETFLEQHRERLKRMVAIRMHPKIRARVDPSDVVQDACVAVVRSVDDFLVNSEQSFYLWVRQITVQKLMELHRHHLGVQARDVGREVPARQRAWVDASSESVVALLIGRLTPPPDRVAQKELETVLKQAVDQMDIVDREVLVLRHFEQMSNTEIAATLEISESASSYRYLAALRRLRQHLKELPCGRDLFGETP